MSINVRATLLALGVFLLAPIIILLLWIGLGAVLIWYGVVNAHALARELFNHL